MVLWSNVGSLMESMNPKPADLTVDSDALVWVSHMSGVMAGSRLGQWAFPSRDHSLPSVLATLAGEIPRAKARAHAAEALEKAEA